MQFTNLTSIDGDAAGNIYLGGGKLNTGTGMDIFVMKLDDDLNVLWTQSYNSDESNYDVANAIHVDKNGNVVVGGKSEIEGEESNYTVIKYNSSGTQQWVASFNGTKNGTDEVTALNSDNSGNIYVTGTSFNGMNKDFHTIKYNTSGTKQWEISHNSIKNSDDIPYGIAKVGDMVLVCGHTGDGNPSNYKLVQYQELEMIVPPDDELISSAYSYQANNGQIVDSNGDLVPEIKYESTNGFPKAYFSDDKVHFVLAKIDTIPTTEDTLYRMDMSFNYNSGPQVYASKRNESYANYFLGGLAEPVTAVPNYKQLIMNDVWSGIDIVYSSNNKGFKMYIICEAGVDPSAVSLKFEGAQNLSSSGSNILLETAIGNIDFSRVTAYQIYSNERTPFETEPSIVIDGEDLRFHFENGYDEQAPVVIEISMAEAFLNTSETYSLDWSTYWGGNASDAFLDVTNDSDGNVIYCGYSKSINFPISSGNNPSTSGLFGQHAVIIKLDNEIEIEWINFLGGNSSSNPNTEARSIVANPQNEIFIGGITAESNFFTEGSGIQYVDDLNLTTSNEGFLAKFNNEGQILWSTLWGLEDEEDWINDIAISNNGYLYAVGYTSSDGIDDFGSTAYYYGGYLPHGLMLMFSQNGELIWKTGLSYSPEQLNACDVDSENNFFVLGKQPLDVYPPIFTGKIVKFNPSNNLENTSINFPFSIVTSKSSALKDIAIDSNDEIYLVGETDFNNMSTFDNGSTDLDHFFEPNYGGAQDLFLAKMSNDLSTFYYRSYYGTDAFDFNPKLHISQNEMLYLTSNIEGYPSTSIPFPSTLSASHYINPYFFSGNGGVIHAFNLDFDLKWSTYWAKAIGLTYSGGEILNSVSSTANRLYFSGKTAGSGGNSLNQIELFDYNPSSNLDYFQPNSGGDFDAFAGFFDLEGINPTSSKEMGNSNNSTIEIFPNPAQSNFMLRIWSDKKQMANLKILDLKGSTIKEIKLNLNNDFNLFPIELDNVSNGIYFIHLNSDNLNLSQKLIKY